jgi:hypothetical protein
MIGGASALGIGVLMVLPAALPASAAPAPIKKIRAGHTLQDVTVHPRITQAQARASARAGTTVPEYTASVKVGTKNFTYTIVGKNPAIKATNPSTTVNAVLVPVIMKFSDGTNWNPTKADSCDAGASALARTQKSPIFVSQSWKFGATSVGSGQYVDAFQRAEFWKFAQPSGINPGFHVKLSLKTLKAITINVPNAQAFVLTQGISCGNGQVGATNFGWLDNRLRKVVIPSLAGQGVGTTTFPIFLLHNFVEICGSQCLAGGYHNAFSVSTGVQTYGVAMYDNSGLATGSSDISILSHEVAEWQNDPSTTNPTPSWGNIGQVTGCQTNLEVGDPLSGTSFKDTLNGFTYHPQELAFFSWFYHQNPSLGVNGWYSNKGTFKTFAAPC